MAIDEALLESVAAGDSPPLLRLYRWSPPAVSLGYAQRGAGQVNLPACRRLGFDVVRRMTGGRAVLHHKEVTYAVAAPDTDDIFPGGILENYRVIAGPLLAAYGALGVPGTLVPGKLRTRTDAVADSVCFTAPSSYEIVCQGKKLTGGAQKRQGGAFLQHGSLPVDLDLDVLWQVLTTGGEERQDAGRQYLQQAVGWINRWLSRPVTIPQVEDLLVRCFAEQLAVSFLPDSLRPAERARAGELVAHKYGRADWNLKGMA